MAVELAPSAFYGQVCSCVDCTTLDPENILCGTRSAELLPVVVWRGQWYTIGWPVEDEVLSIGRISLPIRRCLSCTVMGKAFWGESCARVRSVEDICAFARVGGNALLFVDIRADVGTLQHLSRKAKSLEVPLTTDIYWVKLIPYDKKRGGITPHWYFENGYETVDPMMRLHRVDGILATALLCFDRIVWRAEAEERPIVASPVDPLWSQVLVRNRRNLRGGPNHETYIGHMVPDTYAILCNYVLGGSQ
jgi:hypothetical protein